MAAGGAARSGAAPRVTGWCVPDTRAGKCIAIFPEALYGFPGGGIMDEFRVCPSCEYTRGFHAAFRRDPEGVRIVFICPECGASFDLGIIDSLLNELKPKRGADF